LLGLPAVSTTPIPVVKTFTDAEKLERLWKAHPELHD
jgi:hypothetical protein